MPSKTRYIKLFSHNDLDGFGAPTLFEAVQPDLFKGVVFDLTTCSAGRLDARLASFFRQPDIGRFTDVFIMDMTPDSDYSFQQLEQHFANHWLIFDHHESEANLRAQYASNCINPTNPAINPSIRASVSAGLRPRSRSLVPSMTLSRPVSAGKSSGPPGISRPLSPRFSTFQPVSAARMSGQRSAGP